MNREVSLFTPTRFIGLLLLLVACSYPELVLGRKTLFLGDFNSIAYPTAFFHRTCFWEGELPYWNAYSGAGTPFMASWCAMVFYPITLIYLLLPLGWSLGVFNILHLVWGALGTYVLAQRWTQDRFAAALAGVAFAFNGLTISTLMWPAIVAAHGWMPWVIWANERAWRRGGRWLSLAIVMGGLQMLTGGPENILLTWLLSTVWLVVATGPSRHHLKLLGARYGGVIVGVTIISAIQLLPFIDYLGDSQRSRQFGDAASAVPGWGWANFILPGFYTAPVFHGLAVQQGYSVILSYYAGIGVLLLASLAGFSPRRPLNLGLLVVLLASLTLSLDDQGYVYPWLRQLVPWLGFVRYPVKFLYPTVVVLPLLAAFAIQRLNSPAMTHGQRVGQILPAIALLLTALAGLLWFSRLYPQDHLMRDFWPRVLQQGLWRGLLLLALGGGIILRHHCRKSSWKSGLEIVLVLLVWRDLNTHMMAPMPLVEPWAYAPNYVQMDAAPRLGQGRALVLNATELKLVGAPYESPLQELVCKRNALYGSLNLLERIPKIRGNESLYLRREDEIYGRLNSSPLPKPLADFLGVSHLSSWEKPFTWQYRPSRMPWVTLGQKAVFLDPLPTLAAVSHPDFKPWENVILPLTAGEMVTATNVSSGRVLRADLGLSRSHLQVEAVTSTMLVLAQSWYHPWQAFVDGQATRIWKANGAYQALQIPAGHHEVEIFYQDTAFYSGAVVAWTGLVFLIGLQLRFHRQCRVFTGKKKGSRTSLEPREG